MRGCLAINDTDGMCTACCRAVDAAPTMDGTGPMEAIIKARVLVLHTSLQIGSFWETWPGIFNIAKWQVWAASDGTISLSYRNPNDFVIGFCTDLWKSGTNGHISQYMCWPPFTEIVEPVMKRLSSRTRNQTARAISAGSPRRPTGTVETIFSSTFSGTAATMSVST